MWGAGKYDAATTDLRMKTKARGVIAIVFEGEYGEGFSAQLPPDLLITVPALLRKIADDIDRDLRGQSTH